MKRFKENILLFSFISVVRGYIDFDFKFVLLSLVGERLELKRIGNFERCWCNVICVYICK